MGIKNLSQFLKKYKVYETFNIANLQYKKLAIDAPMFLYKFKSIHPDSTEWISCFITLIAYMRKWDIHPIFIFEGKAPPEKSLTQENRKEQKKKILNKTECLENDLKLYVSNGVVTPLLTETWKKLQVKNPKSILVKQKNSMINVKEMTDEINRRKRYDFSITYDDICTVKELFEIMGVCYIQSKCEAETDCVSLLYDNLVDYIISEDTDVLAYLPAVNMNLKVIVNFNINQSTYTQLSKENILNVLSLKPDSFRDFCIMCGTDYNKNIFRVGVEKSYKFISTFNNIENIPLDITILNHTVVRKLFTVQTGKFNKNDIKWCRVPCVPFVIFLEQMSVFIYRNNLKNIDVNYIFKMLSETDVEIE